MSNSPSAKPRTAVLGFPRIGRERELKFALERYWAKAQTQTAEELQTVAARVRAENWQAAAAAGIDVIPSGDFALYDHVLASAEACSIIAERHRDNGDDELARHFRACRGDDGVTPLRMTKWFDSNYHYLVPELDLGHELALRANPWRDQYMEALALGVRTRPVILGPYSLLTLCADSPLQRLPELTAVYEELVRELAATGVTEIQIDEPCLALDRPESELNNAFAALARINDAADSCEICLATYFTGLDTDVLTRVRDSAFAELHVDLVRAPAQLPHVLAHLPEHMRLSAGIVDGRNVWASDADAALTDLDEIVAAIGAHRLTIASSCSLLHVPYSLDGETDLPADTRTWLAFGREKLTELVLLRDAATADADTRMELLAPARARAKSRRESTLIHDSRTRTRVQALQPSDYNRTQPLTKRKRAQQRRLRLPLLPTTTIGSFPQTQEIRRARQQWRNHEISTASYEEFLRAAIESVIRFQEEVGLDVLVHGESERADMVEYFGEQLQGFAFTHAGWVQSYGSRCVKPPILYGAVARAQPMTVRWWQHAQSLTTRPVKGMLTGPVTILQWSFVRDDQSRERTCTEVALAIQDEVLDLETAGAAIIQVDEAALREGLPLRKRDHAEYLRWAFDCFRLTTAAAAATTQIHTHMCYSDFTDILAELVRLDADVLTVEAARSNMTMLELLHGINYPGALGPGVYDIHSPRIPSGQEIKRLLARAEATVPRERLWVNPDCGLKTRSWPEVRSALTNLVTAAHEQRAEGATAAAP
jgi:5-methyltetrahydropteroyltriglutamate--homocysteine methyltransferase